MSYKRRKHMTLSMYLAKFTWPYNHPLWTQRQLLTYIMVLQLDLKDNVGSHVLAKRLHYDWEDPYKFLKIILIFMITCKIWRPIGKFEVCHCWSLILANICFLSTQASPTLNFNGNGKVETIMPQSNFPLFWPQP